MAKKTENPQARSQYKWLLLEFTRQLQEFDDEGDNGLKFWRDALLTGELPRQLGKLPDIHAVAGLAKQPAATLSEADKAALAIRTEAEALKRWEAARNRGDRSVRRDNREQANEAWARVAEMEMKLRDAGIAHQNIVAEMAPEFTAWVAAGEPCDDLEFFADSEGQQCATPF